MYKSNGQLLADSNSCVFGEELYMHYTRNK